MKPTIHILSLLLFLIFTGCSYHNGGETSLWGTWQLEKFTVNGEDFSEYNGQCFWKFQSYVILIQEVDEDMWEEKDHYGTYQLERDQNILILDFTHYDNSAASGSVLYTPPEYLGITAEIARLEILELNARKLRLRYISQDNNEYIYSLSFRF